MIYVDAEECWSGQNDNWLLQAEQRLARVSEAVENIAGIDIEMSVWLIERTVSLGDREDSCLN